MQRAATLIVVALYALQQDFWFWREALPLVFGALPIGLFSHPADSAVTTGRDSIGKIFLSPRPSTISSCKLTSSLMADG